MTDNDELSSKLSIEPDKSSFAASNREIDKLLSGIEDLEKATDDLGKAQKKNSDTAKGLAKAYKQVRDEAKKAADEAGKARQASVGRTSDAFGKASTGVGSVASVVGGVAGSGASEGIRLAGDIAGAAEQIPALVSSIGALGPVGLAAGVAVTAVGFALGQAIQQNQKLEDAIRSRLAVESQVFEFISTSTREQLQLTRETAAQNLELQRIQLENAKQRRDQLYEEQGYTNSLFDEARKNAGLAFVGLKAQEEEVARLEQSYSNALTATSGYNQALLQNATATRDAAEAEKKLAEQRQSFIDRTLDLQIRTQLQADSLTGDSLQKRLDALTNEKAILETVVQQSNLSEAALEKYRARLQDIATETSTLNYIVAPLVKEREAEAKAIEATRKSIADVISAAGKTISILAEQSGAIRKVNDDLAREISQATSERNKALVEAEREASQARLEAVQERDKALRDNAIEAADQRLKIEEDYQKSVRASQRRFARTSIDAISERDVLAFLQAKQARDDEIRDAKETRAEGLRDVNVQLRKQNQAVIERYNEQLVAVATRLNEQTRVIAERYNEQVRAANEAAQREIQTIRTKYAQELQVIQQGAAASISAAGSFWNGMANLARNALSSVTAASKSATTNPLLKLLGFAKGGYPPTDRPSLVGENGPELIQPRVPSRVYSNQQTQRMMAGGAGNGINIPISVSGVGMGIPQIEKAVIDKLHEALVMVVGD
jgi:hypothetical protein